MKAKKFEQQFDEGVDITASLDLSKAKRVLQEQKRVNVDFPTWMIDSLDREASKLGVTRQSVIKVWLAERLEATASSNRLAHTDTQHQVAASRRMPGAGGLRR
jgi:hypothetical protein